MSFFNDPWVIGIGSGLIISGLWNLYYISRENKFKKHKIKTANEEIVNAMTPFISKGNIPSNDTIEDYINATSRKYNLKRKKIYNPIDIFSETRKFIIDSQLIEDDDKKKLLELLDKHSLNLPALFSDSTWRSGIEDIGASGEYKSSAYKIIFEDDFEEETDWERLDNGIITRSTDFYHGGKYSLKKDVHGDFHGGYRTLGRQIDLGIIFSGWLYRPLVPSNNLGERLAIEDENFNGYGFCIAHNSNKVWIERRDEKVAQPISTQSQFNPPEDEWYMFKLYLRTDGKFMLILYDESYKKLVKVHSYIDQRYTSFDRIAIHGGYPYYVDDLKIELLD